MSSGQVEGMKSSSEAEQNVKPEHQERSGLEGIPKILKADESGAPVVPPEVAETAEKEKTETKEIQAQPNNVLHEMEVQTGQ
ncbi:hypothetical protein Mapa_008841 [Marchantia paleacea]|nr:hypothetical protein Mapa_008841 [Marchantia paleacea]